jgi:hypothetical protein
LAYIVPKPPPCRKKSSARLCPVATYQNTGCFRAKRSGRRKEGFHRAKRN